MWAESSAGLPYTAHAARCATLGWRTPAFVAAWFGVVLGVRTVGAAPDRELGIEVEVADRPVLTKPSPAARPSLQAVRSGARIRLDGVLDDPVWTRAPESDVFTQKFPNDGQPPSERTRLRVAYDNAALYIAFDCDQERTPLVARLARRDRDVGADRVEVSVSDGARTFAFWVSASGVVGDGIRFNDTDYSSDWDGVWDARVSQRVGGWSAEFRIPLFIFRVTPTSATQDWALQARRYLPARQETVEWAYSPRTVVGEVSRYGKLTGLVGLRPGNPIELRPFLVARGSRDAAGPHVDATAGIDARWRLTQNIGLDVSVNPDFAQVEADEQALNLTTFETFLPEKRPFFLDGMDLFQLPRMAYFPSGQSLFYTRRVGAVPDAPTTDGRVLGTPEPVTIYGAAKLRGIIGAGIAGSVLSAVTGRGDVTVEQADGARAEIAAAPLTWFNVVRSRVAVGQQAQVGVQATATNRFEELDRYPPGPAVAPAMQSCPTGTAVAVGERCFHDSYVASADGYWRSSSGDYVLSGQALMSAISGGPARTMLDGTVIAAGDVGAGGSVFALKEGGNWLGSVEVEAAGRKLDYNDLGYMQRQNQLRLLPTAEYRAITPFESIAESRVRLSASLRETVDGLNLWRGYYAFTEWKLKSSWSASTLVYYLGSRFDDREVGDGTALERAGGIGWDLAVSSDPSARVSAGLSSEMVIRREGHEATGTAQIDLHLLPQLELHLQGQATSTRGEVRFLETGAQPTEYLFGKLDARSLGLTLRASYAMTTRLTLQLYTRALLSSKSYYDYQSFTSGLVRPLIRLAELTPAVAPATEPADELASLDVNAVLRWEPRPGSAVFVVYTRSQSQAPGRESAMGERPGLDLGALRGGPASDALLLKLSYWWN